MFNTLLSPGYLSFLLIALLISCGGYAQSTPAPIRFLLTFDDGPSGAKKNNPSAHILNVLAENKIQPGIKAIFFVQTRTRGGGSTAIGRELLKREYREGHLLAFHTATSRHENHRYLDPEEFVLSVQQGIQDLTEISGTAPRLVRPPFWNYDTRTLHTYHQQGLHMLLTDLSANDGKIRGINWSWHKHANLLKQLRLTKQHWAAGKIPAVNGNTPIVVTFHDLNPYTAQKMEVYLAILLQVAAELELPTAAKPFYDNRVDLERAALTRTVQDAHTKPRLPGLWNWLWQ